jgi:hypothetical protein
MRRLALGGPHRQRQGLHLVSMHHSASPLARWHATHVPLIGRGNGLSGQLGHSNEASVDRPKLVQACLGMKVLYIACGSYHTAALVGTTMILLVYLCLADLALIGGGIMRTCYARHQRCVGLGLQSGISARAQGRVFCDSSDQQSTPQRTAHHHGHLRDRPNCSPVWYAACAHSRVGEHGL